MYHYINGCRACGYGTKGPIGIKAGAPERLLPVFSLGWQPLANDFVKECGIHSGAAPLEVLYCPRCSLAQLSIVVDPAILYSHNYTYVTSTSKTMRDHLGSLMSLMLDKLRVNDWTNVSVLEVGSNDGAFLAMLKECWATVIGIDPAENLADKANTNGIKTIPSVMSRRSAEQVAGLIGPVDAIIARHVFCHVDNWVEFMNSIRIAGTNDSLLFVEAPYAVSQLSAGSVDQVYHEHLSYLSLKAAAAICARTGFRIRAVNFFPIHGGCAVLTIVQDTAKVSDEEAAQVQSLIDLEGDMESRWRSFARDSKELIGQITAMVRSLREQGNMVVGYGASAKSTVMVNACGFTRADISFITDTTPAKQYTTSPGTDIPIVDPGALTRELPNYAVCFAWNFFDEIYEKETVFREKGGKWIVPCPKLRVV